MCTPQAKQAFRQWHAQRWLAPAKLLEQKSTSVRPVLLPFWLFETSVRVQSSASLGFAAEGCAACAFPNNDARCKAWTSRQLKAPLHLQTTAVHAPELNGSEMSPCRKQDGSMIWRESEQRSQHREYPWTLGSMQIYGSYKYRRDFIEAVKCPGSLSRTRLLKASCSNLAWEICTGDAI